MVVSARRTGLSISKTVDELGFSHTTASRVYTERCEKHKKHLLIGSSTGGKTPCWQKVTCQTDRKTTIIKALLFTDTVRRTFISERTTHQKLEADVLQELIIVT